MWACGYVVGQWAGVGQTMEGSDLHLHTPSGGLLQEAQVQHSSRGTAQERGQVGAGDRAKGRISGSLDDHYLTVPPTLGLYVYPILLFPSSHVNLSPAPGILGLPSPLNHFSLSFSLKKEAYEVEVHRLLRYGLGH